MMTLTTGLTDTSLALDSLEIKKFRGFQHLQIPRLGRVNLITGRNNAGKSSLLEAILLYTRLGSPEAFWRILRSREVIKSEANTSEVLRDAVLFTFHNAVVSGSIYQHKALSFDISKFGGVQSLHVHLALPHLEQTGQLAIATRFPNHNVLYDAARILETPNHGFFEQETAIPTQFIIAHGLERIQIGSLWDNIALTEFKAILVDALRLIEPQCIDLNLRGDAGIGLGRVPYVLLESQDEPVPLSLLGDGMNRLFGLMLALVNAENGVLLIDEVETGLHYSVLPAMWRLIFLLAHQLNTQLFATTHSWECIVAFQKAAAEDEQDNGVLIRLDNKNGDVKATVFDERRLAIVTRDQIEVR